MVESGVKNQVKKSLFVGKYEHTLDSKYRVTIPSNFRLGLSEKCYVANSLTEKCLEIYTEEEYFEIYNDLKSKIRRTDTEGQKLLRTFSANSQISEIDKQGRIVLREDHRKYAGIGTKVVVNGNFDKIEIWDYDSWNKFEKDVDPLEMVKMLDQKLEGMEK